MYSSPVVVCRPALPSDAPDVLEFTKFIWDGHDYIKYVWRDWLADPRGLLAVAEYGGHAVGLGKITFLADGQWWLEGLRVDPKYQGLKISSHMFEYLDDWWQQHGGGAVRLMTSSERVQVHHLSARLGYAKIGEVRSYTAAAAAGAAHGFSVLTPAQGSAAWERLRGSLGYANGLMDSGWRFSTPDAATLASRAEQGLLLSWRGEKGLLCCWEDDNDDGEKVLGVGFAACQLDALKDLLLDIPSLAHELGYASVVWLAPAVPQVEGTLNEAGYKTEWDGTGFLFGKTIAG
jgi:GNAT superfamily N-acetyltransferase